MRRLACRQSGMRYGWAIVGVALLLAAQPVLADMPVLEWSATYSGLESAEGYGVAVNDGGVCVTGNTWAGGDLADMFLIKCDFAGDTLWDRTWGGSDRDRASRVALSGTHAYVAGDSLGDAVTVRWTADGDLDPHDPAGWWTWHAGDGGYVGYDRAYDLVLDASENLYVTGYEEHGYVNAWGYVEKYDSNAAELWHQHYGIPQTYRQTVCRAVDISGTDIYAAAYQQPSGPDVQVLTLKHDGDGTLVWSDLWGDPARDEYAWAQAVSGNDIYITGWAGATADPNGRDLLLLKLHDDGPSVSFVDSTVFVGPGNDIGQGIVVAGGGIYVVASTDVGGHTDALLLAYDTDLNLLWEHSWGGAGDDAAYDVAFHDGVIYVTGIVDNEAFVNAYTLGPASYNVCWDGSGDYTTIQAAIDAATDGDTVVVCDGTYTGPGNKDLDFAGKAVTVRSENGPDNCIIDCEGSEEEPHRGFHFHSGEGSDSMLDGFTITGGHGSDFGGGIRCDSGSNPTISDCVITSCVGPSRGAGMYIEDSGPAVTNCAFVGNGPASWGAGMCAYNSSVTLGGCTFVGNQATAYGGGLQAENNSNITLTNCLFTGNACTHYQGGGAGIACHSGSNVVMYNCSIIENTGSYGGGVSVLHPDTTATIVNCVIARNSATGDPPDRGYGGGIACYWESAMTVINCTIADNSATVDGGGMACFWSSNSMANNCILWGNSAPDGPQMAVGRQDEPDPATALIGWSDVSGGQAEVYVYAGSTLTWGDGNIDADPVFADPDGPDNDPDTWDDNDYRLSFTSPCIDAGDTTAVPAELFVDLDGNGRVLDWPSTDDTGTPAPIVPVTVDMGAYEFDSPLGDINGDGLSDFFDIDPFVALITGA